jgi:preprotein translocase subunit YajC
MRGLFPCFSERSVHVLFTLLELIRWLQPEATGGGGGGAGGGGAEAVGGGSGCATQGIMLLVMVAIFYFLLMRPQQKRQKEHEAMLKALRKGAIVRTSGGIRGEIFEVGERDVTLIVADKVKINVLRSNVAGAEPDPSQQKDDDKGKEEKKE